MPVKEVFKRAPNTLIKICLLFQRSRLGLGRNAYTFS